jgi:hypothetical protein
MAMEVSNMEHWLPRRCRPAMLIEVARDNLEAFAAWRDTEGYAVVREFEYVNAVNIYLEARS